MPALTRRYVVDGQTFEVAPVDDVPNAYDYQWLNRHGGEYGFRSVGLVGEVDHERRIHEFLQEVDPETGYLPDT